MDSTSLYKGIGQGLVVASSFAIVVSLVGVIALADTVAMPAIGCGGLLFLAAGASLWAHGSSLEGRVQPAKAG